MRRRRGMSIGSRVGITDDHSSGIAREVGRSVVDHDRSHCNDKSHALFGSSASAFVPRARSHGHQEP